MINGEIAWLLRSDPESPGKRFILGKLRNLWPCTALVLGIALERLIRFVRDAFIHVGYRGSATFECLRGPLPPIRTRLARLRMVRPRCVMQNVRRHCAL